MIERLGIGDVHIWYLWPDRVMDSTRLARHEEMLSVDERLQNRSFHFDEQRRSHLLTRAFVRTLLSRYADVRPSDWQFVRTPHGKPEIVGPAGAPVINFSLSHTAGLIVCAFATAAFVGIDAENLEHPVESLQIAEKYFAPSEYRVLQGLTSAARHRQFFEYWTLKESYAKARGLGMSLDLSRFAFHIEGQRIGITFEAPDAETPTAWQFRLFSPGDHHIVAAAVRGDSDTPVAFNQLDGTSLMQ